MKLQHILSSVGRRGGWLLPLLLLLLLLIPLTAQAQNPYPPSPPPPMADSRFGAVEAYDAPHIAKAAGVGWGRVIFWWHQMQPTGPNDWNPHYFPDGQMNNELAEGRELVGLLAGTPAWASDSGSVRAVPSGLYLPYDDPNNLWGNFVYKMADYYAGKIDRWVIWNEPDVWDDSHPGKTWEGTVEDFVQLQKVAYQAAHAANPNVKLHLAATTYWWDVQYGRPLYIRGLLDAINAEPEAAANNHFFDVGTFHIYFHPDQVYELTKLYRDIFDEKGFADKPLWINETNAPPSEDPLHPAPGLLFDVTLEDQSYFLMQAWAGGLAAGAERISLYKTRDERSLPIGVEPYGLMRKDGSVRPVFWTYRTLVTYLSGYQSAEMHREGWARRVTVNRGDLGRTIVVWNQGLHAQEMRVPANAGDGLLVGPFGMLKRISPANGFYRVVLPGSRNGQVGGIPYMIVEGAGSSVDLPVPAEFPGVIPDPQTLEPDPSVLPPIIPPPNAGDDWAIAGGRFFTQAGNNAGGFAVVDNAEAGFWSAFQRLGGLQNVGYPISQRFVYEGFVTQAFQKLVLQWRPEANTAYPVNVFDELSERGFDSQLLNFRQTPPPLVDFDPPGATWDEIVAARQALLDENAAIRARYFGQRDPMTVYGLPLTHAEDMGNHYALRTQRAVFQQWKEEVPWAAAGEVTIANGGDIAKELGWLPEAALIAQPVAGP